MSLSTHPISPLPNTYWVIPNRFLAGEYPGAVDDEEAIRKLRHLLDAGITTWIDLTEPDEYALHPYRPHLEALAQQTGREIEYLRLSIPDLSIPTHDEMQTILDALDERMDEQKCVYVHCYGGIGRTGTVVGCFLARHGTNGEAALQRIEELRSGIAKAWRTSPETYEQKQMVIQWQE